MKTFSATDHNADFYPRDVRLNALGIASFTLVTPVGEVGVELGIMGQHNVANALAAAALSLEMGASLAEIGQGLAHLSKVKGRVDMAQLRDDITLIDDSYNASVPAMKAAVELLGSFSAVRWLILGNMAELGDESLALHQQVGEHAAPFGFEFVLTYGKDAKVISDLCQGHHFATHQDMMTFIEQHIEQQQGRTQVLLVKGANSAGMSKIAAALKEKFA